MFLESLLNFGITLIYLWYCNLVISFNMLNKLNFPTFVINKFSILIITQTVKPIFNLPNIYNIKFRSLVGWARVESNLNKLCFYVCFTVILHRNLMASIYKLLIKNILLITKFKLLFLTKNFSFFTPNTAKKFTKIITNYICCYPLKQPCLKTKCLF